jgi:hypothetical protein
VTGRFIRLEISEDEFFLKNAKLYELILKFPIRLNRDKVDAKFMTKERKLIVEIDVSFKHFSII